MRTACTLIELLVVVAITAVLAGIRAPALALAREAARQTRCLDRHARLMEAMLAYRADHRHRWPAVAPAASFDPHAATDHLAIAIGSLELLAAETGLERRLLACPGREGHHPRLPASRDAAERHLGWAFGDPTTTGTQALTGYAYDWAVPLGATVDRVVLGDRGPDNHRDAVHVAYADGHVARLEPIDQTCARQLATITLDGQFAARPVHNPEREEDTLQDDIFDPLGDTGGRDPHRPGGGDPQRAWLR